MTISRLVWVVVIVLLIAVAFTAGVVLASVNAQRVAFAGARYGFGPGMMARGYGAQPDYGMMSLHQRTMYGSSRGFAPGNDRRFGRMNGRGFAPSYGRGVAPGAGRGAGRTMPGGWRC